MTVLRQEVHAPIPTGMAIDPVRCNAARQHASKHRAEIQASARCGCYFCFRTFPHSDIRAWVDSNETALCPACGIDAVIGDASKHRLDGRFLRQMHTLFFSSRR
jgi:hypothetical protein